MTKTPNSILTLALSMLTTAVPTASAGTCALCREVLRSGGNLGLIKGYYWSIVLIVSVPLVFLTLGIRYAWRRYS